jgi:Na+/H+ antiporter NhaD/arsenite permease-like protein
LPIGRPAGALLGAVLMVAAGALTPAESYAAIDGDTLILLFGMMLLTGELAEVGFFDRASGWLLRAGRTPRRLLVVVALGSGALSAFLVNDTVCLFVTPVLLVACRQAGLPVAPYLIALATSANIGSAATLVGNPQNMLIGTMSGLSFPRFLAIAGPAAALALALNAALLVLVYGRRLPVRLGSDSQAGDHAPARPPLGPMPPPPPLPPRFLLVCAALAAVVTAFFAGAHLGYATLTGAALLLCTHRRDASATLARVDWSLLVFFSGLFIVVAGLRTTGLVDLAWTAVAPHLDLGSPAGLVSFSTAMTVGSNLVSNVPLVMLAGPYLPSLGNPDAGFVLLAFTTTIAGNLTLVGSVANIIVAEGARASGGLGFLEHLRFGLLSTPLTLAAGVPLIACLAG